MQRNEIQCPTTPRNSENATPGVEELGLSPSHQKSRCSAAYQSSPISPAKESPSKRKKLIGSLRSMTYLRSVQTPSPKAKNEKIRELHSESVVCIAWYPQKEASLSKSCRHLALLFERSGLPLPSISKKALPISPCSMKSNVRYPVRRAHSSTILHQYPFLRYLSQRIRSVVRTRCLAVYLAERFRLRPRRYSSCCAMTRFMLVV